MKRNVLQARSWYLRLKLLLDAYQGHFRPSLLEQKWIASKLDPIYFWCGYAFCLQEIMWIRCSSGSLSDLLLDHFQRRSSLDLIHFCSCKLSLIIKYLLNKKTRNLSKFSNFVYLSKPAHMRASLQHIKQHQRHISFIKMLLYCLNVCVFTLCY